MKRDQIYYLWNLTFSSLTSIAENFRVTRYFNIINALSSFCMFNISFFLAIRIKIELKYDVELSYWVDQLRYWHSRMCPKFSITIFNAIWVHTMKISTCLFSTHFLILFIAVYCKFTVWCYFISRTHAYGNFGSRASLFLFYSILT